MAALACLIKMGRPNTAEGSGKLKEAADAVFKEVYSWLEENLVPKEGRQVSTRAGVVDCEWYYCYEVEEAS